MSEENKGSQIPEKTEAVDPQAVESTHEHHHHSDHEHHHHSHHEHHHHSHHGHHSSRHHKRRHSKDKKLKAFFKRYKKPLQATAVASGFAVLLLLLLMMEFGAFRSNEDQDVPYQVADQVPYEKTYAYIGAPVISEEVDLANATVRDYMQSDPSVTMSHIMSEHTGEEGRKDQGRPLVLRFDVYHLPSGITVTDQRLMLSETDSFEDHRIYPLDSEYQATIYNLKSGTKYHYRALFTLSDGQVITYGGSFTTMAGPRMMTIDGVYNVRDVGGWITAENKRVKQGLLYRGTELDGAVESKYKLSEESAKYMVMDLGIKYDLDLRSSTDHVSGPYSLGSSVTHQYYGMGMYDGIFTDSGKPAVREVFRDLAKPANYPMYIHCTYGCDRTGTACYLLGALLGMSESDLIKEYELSGAYFSQITRDNINIVYDELQKFDGDTLQEKTESYLLSIGVTMEEIQSIRNIFLEEVK